MRAGHRWLIGLCLLGACLAAECAEAQPAGPPAAVQARDGGAASHPGRLAEALAAGDADRNETEPLGARGGMSALYALSSGGDAWAARLLLVERAQRGIDLQYYIFRPDRSGTALLTALERAASRGVRVRLLLDDWGAKPDAATLRRLAAHPNIAVRLYNPMAHAESALLSLLFDFERTQRRMHNKLLVADGRAAIVGGRNVGDEYFARRPELEFGDLDLLAFGAVVPQFAAGFDRFWNEAPVVELDPSQAPATNASSILRSSRESLRPADDQIDAAARDFEARLSSGALRRYVALAEAVQDQPHKADPALAAQAGHLGHELARVMGQVHNELLLVSPYFVPGAGGVEQLRALRERGVRVVVITNSLAATDVPAVHAGYARYREALLAAGVELHELRGDGPARQRGRERGGSSRLSLHAKVIVVDRRQVFVGSMNIDPRSLHLNSENGVVVASQALGNDLAEGVRQALSNGTWRVTLEAGRLVWRTERDGGATVQYQEPGAGLWLRLQVRVLSWLPIERLL